MFDISCHLHYNTTRTIVRCTMRLSVREIINTPGKKISFQFSMDLSSVEFGGYCPVAEPVVVTGEIRNMAGVLVLTGKAETTLHAFCDRCGKALLRPKTVSFEHMLARELANEDDADDDEIAAGCGLAVGGGTLCCGDAEQIDDRRQNQADPRRRTEFEFIRIVFHFPFSSF